MSNLSADLSTVFGSNNNISRVTVVKRNRNGEEVAYTKEFASDNAGIPSLKGKTDATDKQVTVDKKDETPAKNVYSSIPEVSAYEDKGVGLKMNPVLVNSFNADIEKGKADALKTIRTIELAGRIEADNIPETKENSDAPADTDKANIEA